MFWRGDENQPSQPILFAAFEKCVEFKNLYELFECKKLLLAADFIKELFLHLVICCFEIHLHSSFLVRCGFIIHYFQKKSSDFAQIQRLLFVQLYQRFELLFLFSLNRIRNKDDFILYLLHNRERLILSNSNKTSHLSEK